MNVSRLIYCYRRRRKQNFFILIFFILISSIFICYWSIEMHFSKNEEDLFKNQNQIQSENVQLAKSNPILNKFIQPPFNINVWNIIQQANLKYEQNHSNSKYLVYSCRFMCGGTIFYLLIDIFKIKFRLG